MGEPKATVWAPLKLEQDASVNSKLAFETGFSIITLMQNELQSAPSALFILSIHQIYALTNYLFQLQGLLVAIDQVKGPIVKQHLAHKVVGKQKYLLLRFAQWSWQ